MIEFIDLKREYRSIKLQIQEAIDRVLEKQWFLFGSELEEFEDEFKKYIGTKYAIGVNSGSDALYLALKALNLRRGDEVLTVSFTFVSTVDAILRNNAIPKFIDIDEDSFTIDTSKLEEQITDKTKAIIPVHIYGQPANMDHLTEVAEKHGLYVIEDACQAHGAEYKNIKAGNLGDIGCFSFYPTKNIGAYGDAGMLVTNNEELAEKIKLLHNYGSPKKYYHDFIGINSRLDEIQAAILKVKLKFLNNWNNLRRENANLYNQLLEDSDIIIPREVPDRKHVYHLYVIRSKERDKLKQYLMRNGIMTLIHYPIPVHKQKAYSNFKDLYILPTTEKVCNEVLSLPMYPWLEKEQIEFISNSINNFN